MLYGVETKHINQALKNNPEKFPAGYVFELDKFETKLLAKLFNSKKGKKMGIKPGPKRIAKSTGKPDRRQHDNKKTPGNTPSLKPHHHKKGD